MASVKTVAAAVGAAVAVGAGAALVVKTYVDKRVPADVVAQLQRFRFEDVDTEETLLIAQLLQKGKEGEFAETYLFGLGLQGKLPNDVIVEIGKDLPSGSYSATISKHGWDAVDVYLDDVKVRSLPRYVPTTGNLSGVCMFTPTI